MLFFYPHVPIHTTQFPTTKLKSTLIQRVVVFLEFHLAYVNRSAWDYYIKKKHLQATASIPYSPYFPNSPYFPRFSLFSSLLRSSPPPPLSSPHPVCLGVFLFPLDATVFIFTSGNIVFNKVNLFYVLYVVRFISISPSVAILKSGLNCILSHRSVEVDLFLFNAFCCCFCSCSLVGMF